MGPSIKYVTLFWTNFDFPPSVILCHTSRDLLKYVTHLGPPIFSSTCIGPTYMSLQGVWVSSRGFLFGSLSGGFCLEGFVRSGFCPPPPVRIHPLQQKTKYPFQF